MNLDKFRQKHIANDLTVFEDFRQAVSNMTDDDTDTLFSFWNGFPNATWTRACGFMVEDLVIYQKKYKLAKLFWDHDMFRMGGRYRAEQMKDIFLNHSECLTP